MVRDSREEWKVYGNVFDKFTLERLEKLRSQHHFDELESPVSIGKEANIFIARKADNTKVILKIYRLHTCNFNKMYDYIKSDPRFTNLKKQRRKIIFGWVSREYRNLMKARELVNVPRPVVVLDHILLLELIGDDSPSLPLKDDLPEDKESFSKKIIQEMKNLRKLGLVHGDLSEFNILNYRQTPVFIDFSQSTTSEHPSYDEYWVRDIKNIARYFKKIGIKITEEELKKQIIK